MCGLVSVFGDLSDTDTEMFKKLLFLDTVRGPHSTGVAAISLDREPVEIYKKAVDGADFLKEKQTQELIVVTKVGLIGHNRWATNGAVTDANAHPFRHGHITGVHNGTLSYNYKDHLFENIAAPTGLDVDSDHLYYALSRGETEDVLNRTHGALALIWYNQQEHRLYFVRNDKRPLVYGMTKDQKRFYLMSDPKMFLTARENVRGDVELEQSGLLRIVEENTLYGLDLPHTYGKKFKDFSVHKKIPIGTKYKTYVYAGHTYGKGGRDDWDKDDSYFFGRRETTKSTSVVDAERQNKYRKYVAPKETTNPNKLSIEQLEEKSKNIWKNYTIACEGKKNSPRFVESLKNTVEKASRKEIIRYIRNFFDVQKRLVTCWDYEVIPGTKEYYPDQVRDICTLMSRMDWYVELLYYWYKTKPKAVIDTVLHQAKLEEPENNIEELIKAIEAVNYINIDKLILTDNVVVDIRKKEENTVARLDGPSGCGNMTLMAFKKLIRSCGCSVCGAQDVSWEGDQCGLTTEKQLICPDCMTDALTASYIAQGVIKLVS